MNALTRRRLTGSPLRSAAELGVLGGGGMVSALFAAGVTARLGHRGLLHAMQDWGSDESFLLVVPLALASSALLGALLPAALDWARHRLSLRSLGALGLLSGYAWGVAVALAWMSLSGRWHQDEVFGILGFIGAGVFSLVWLPHTVLTVLQAQRWPALALGTPAVGALIGALTWWIFAPH